MLLIFLIYNFMASLMSPPALSDFRLTTLRRGDGSYQLSHVWDRLLRTDDRQRKCQSWWRLPAWSRNVNEMLFWLYRVISYGLPRSVLSTYWCCPSTPCVVFFGCVHLALFLALFLSPGIISSSLVALWCDHCMLASLRREWVGSTFAKPFV